MQPIVITEADIPAGQAYIKAFLAEQMSKMLVMLAEQLDSHATTLWEDEPRVRCVLKSYGDQYRELAADLLKEGKCQS